MVNKNHPDYKKYKAECDKITEEFYEKKLEMRKELDGCLGLDYKPLTSIDKECLIEIKAVKEKYSHLFEGSD